MVQYNVKKVNGFTKEDGEYTGGKTTLWQWYVPVNGFAVMQGNIVKHVYKRKYLAMQVCDALNAKEK